MTADASPIDWERAERIALLVASRRPAPVGVAHTGLHEPAALEDRIEAVTGLRSANGVADVRLIDRGEWIRANLSSFRRMLAPLFDRWSVGSSGPTRTVTRQIAGIEMGALLGWMSTRVLGQYDVLMGGSGDAVYLVAPNLAMVEQQYGFEPGEFRPWVLLHELTHRAQFTGVPWMRDHFTGLVDESLRLTDPDPRALLASLKEALRDRDEARRQIRESGVVGLVANPAQRAVIARIGGLMSLLEGHGDVTMTRAAGSLVPSAERFARVLGERRRTTNSLTRLVQRVTGLEAKLNQYAAGERFIAAIEIEGGPRAVDVCWEQPANVPSLDEIKAPTMWMRRVGLRVA